MRLIEGRLRDARGGFMDRNFGDTAFGWLCPTVFLGAAQRRLVQKGLLILAYHRLGSAPRSSRDPFLYDTPAGFDAQLAKLRGSGLVPATLSEPLQSWNRSPAGAVISFDDGCSSVLEQGLAALSRHGFAAIQFLVAGFIGKRNEWDVSKGDHPEPLMDDHQVREWLAAGHSIGSHSLTHRNLRHLERARLREEIIGSKGALEDRFGVPVLHFAYPFGAWNEAVRDCVAEAGYLTACTMAFGVNTSATPRFELRRIAPLSSARLLRKVLHRFGRKLWGRS